MLQFKFSVKSCSPATVFIFTIFHLVIFFDFFSNDREVSQKINGLRSLSTDQLSFLKSDALSTLKRESRGIVVCILKGDNLLCSDKNSSFVVF